ncbi:MAG TPA: hypothetical protein VGP94_01445, partial [Tepidisphaeraceae bacterium]|nr:hypothetical protein [Tepidisphaeraceae bacterium]
SGILGEGWYLADVQAHKANPDAELVEFGQLLLIDTHVPAAEGHDDVPALNVTSASAGNDATTAVKKTDAGVFVDKPISVLA